MFLSTQDFSSPFVVLLHTEKRCEKPYELLIFKQRRSGGTVCIFEPHGRNPLMCLPITTETGAPAGNRRSAYSNNMPGHFVWLMQYMSADWKECRLPGVPGRRDDLLQQIIIQKITWLGDQGPHHMHHCARLVH